MSLNHIFNLLISSYLLASLPILAENTQPVIQTLTPSESYVDVDHSALFCRTVGKGSPLVVIHGGPGLSQDYLLPGMIELARDYKVVFYDQRGCGRSTGPISPETISVEDLVRDIDAIRHSLNAEKITLLGHSWGGFLAMKYAIAYPENVEGLILANSMPASSGEVAIFIQEWIRRTAPLKKELDAIQASQGYAEGDPATIEPYYLTMFRAYCYQPEKANLLNVRPLKEAALREMQTGALLKKEAFSSTFNLHEELAKLRIPTLVIHGDHDLIPPCTAKAIHDSIPNSTYILMKECGHFPYVEDPEEFFRYIREFSK